MGIITFGLGLGNAYVRFSKAAGAARIEVARATRAKILAIISKDEKYIFKSVRRKGVSILVKRTSRTGPGECNEREVGKERRE